MSDYAEAYILVDGKIRAIPGAPVGNPPAVPALSLTRLALKNCASFTKCNLEINDEHLDTAENLDIVMPMYNLIEYSDNYQDSSAMLYQYERDEPLANTANKVKLLGNPILDNIVATLNVNVVVPLKYLSNFFRSLEMPLINCKIKLKDFKNLFIGMNIKQKNKLKM